MPTSPHISPQITTHCNDLAPRCIVAHIACPLIPTCHHIFRHSARRGGITTSYDHLFPHITTYFVVQRGERRNKTTSYPVPVLYDHIIPTISPHIPTFLGLYFKVQNMIFFSNQPTVRWYTCTVQCIVVYIICIRTRFIVSSLRLDVVNSHIRPHCGRIWLHVVTCGQLFRPCRLKR